MKKEFLRKKVAVRTTTMKDYLEVGNLLKISGLSGRWFTRPLFKKLLRKNNGFYLVAETKGKIVGSLFASHDGGYCGHLYKLVVAPEFRRRRVGSALMKEAIRRLHRVKVDWVFLHVAKNNKRSVQFCESLEFKKRPHFLMDNYQR